MQDFYDTDIIPKILNIFKVKNVVVSGVNDADLLNSILKHDSIVTQINTNDVDCIKDAPLNILSNLENYDAIFVNDDSNWYTVFNELNIIKKTNEEFPLVFICNNIFPNKRRDSYSNPENIPSNFRQKYMNGLPICYNNEKIIISDGFYHACEDNTPKNGVLTAIEDFLKENSHIGIIEINFIKEICMLYPKLQINQKRISIISKAIQNDKIDGVNLSDKLIENQLLVSYIEEYNLHNENLNELEVEISRKDSIIEDYENKIRNRNNEIILKDSQISGFESNLSLKDSQIKNFESKLVNRNRKINDLEAQLLSVNNDLDSLNREVDVRDVKINDLEAQLLSVNNDLDSLNREVDVKGVKINDLEAQLLSVNNDLDSLNLEVDVKGVKINDLEAQLENNNNNLNSLTQEINNKNIMINDLTFDFKQRESNYVNQIDSLNNQLDQKDKILKNNENKINSLKNDFAVKENNFNNQINASRENIKLKDTQIEIQQLELDEKKMRINSLEHSYTRQLSKIDNNEYCIHCFKEEISNNHLEIKYLKNNTFIKKILSPLAYAYLILKSNPKEISLNIKLYQALKDSKCFDIGFYLNNNKDLIESKWCRYFSPELHYVCNGFSENRTFNKKYFNRTSKIELLQYLLTCDE